MTQAVQESDDLKPAKIIPVSEPGLGLEGVLRVDIPEKDYAELLTLNGAVGYLARRCGVA